MSVRNDEQDGTDGLEDQIAEALVRSKQTAAAAESLTGGNVSAALSAIEGASDWFLGGVVAYAEEVKYALLGVERGPVINAKVPCRWPKAWLGCWTPTAVRQWRRTRTSCGDRMVPCSLRRATELPPGPDDLAAASSSPLEFLLVFLTILLVSNVCSSSM